MEGKRLLRSLSLKNILSFGPEGVEIEFQPLNVLIGPNGSGKSNFLEAIRLLKAAPRDLTQPIREGGGINEWIWKGEKALPRVIIMAVIQHPGDAVIPPGETDIIPLEDSYLLAHYLEFAASGQRVEILDEAIGTIDDQSDTVPTWNLYNYPRRTIAVMERPKTGKGLVVSSYQRRNIDPKELKPDQSVLSQRNDPTFYPDLYY